MLGSSIQMAGGATTLISTVSDLPDDIYLGVGDDSDGVILNRSTILNANTALTGVLIGTVDGNALAANSLIISNTTTDGDVAFYGNDGGHSQQFMFFDSSQPRLYMDEVVEFGTSCIFHGALNIDADDVAMNIGDSADFQMWYETADADAKIAIFTIDESDDPGNNVPVFAFMEETNSANALNLFDTFVQPLVCVIDNDKDSWCGISFSADDVPILSTNRTGANGIVITNPKNAAASALSGTQLDVEIDIGGTPYHFTVYPTKA